MRVVHLACVAPPQTGGIGQVTFFEVTELNKRGVDSVLIAPDYPGSLTVNGVKRLKTEWSFGNAACLKKSALLSLFNSADIVHLHYPFYGTAGLIAGLRRQNKIKRLVMTLHMDASAPGIKGMFFNLHRKFFQHNILQTADVMLVSSLDYAKHSSFAPFVNCGQMHELPFGIDEMRFSPGSKERLRFGLEENSKVVLFVGGMDQAHAFKGIPILLKALVKMPDVYCLLAGEGDLRLMYEQLADRLGVASRVKFLGRVPLNELPDLYRTANVFVLPSISGAEAFGLVALEAHACGVPVVASDLPGVRTVVQNEVTGFLVPCGDEYALASALDRVLQDKLLQVRMGEMARRRVMEKFTLSKHLDLLLKEYLKISSEL